MEQILEMAGKVSDKAEVFSIEYRTDGVSFENARFKDIDSRIQSGISLRIIKDGKQGFAYTKNPVRREDLIQNALDSLKGGVEGAFDFPVTRDLPVLNTYDAAIETISNAELVEECERVCGILSGKITGQINVSAHKAASSIRIVNSAGSDLSWKTSSYVFNPELIYPYSASALQRTLLKKSFEKAGDEYLNFLADLYSKSKREVNIEGGRMKVLFLPETMYVLLWRLNAAANGQSIYQNISPLADKIGVRIFDGRLSVINDPLDDSFPGARACDDEGVRCRKYPIIENGILKNFYYDLSFAQKLNALPSGNGFRAGESSKPVPVLRHVSIPPGDKSFSQLLQSMDQGIIIAGALGAHSGNIPNGDFSIGISPALYVEGGEITGHIKDSMAAGNIYDTFNRMAGIEDAAHLCMGGRFPSLLFADVSITSKKGG
jgi:PmbA protein